MNSQKNIQDELNALGSALPVSNEHPFSAPEGYFEGLPAEILAKIKASERPVQSELNELSPLLASISKSMPYSVPLFYFEENLETAVNIVTDSKSPVLDSMGKHLPYQAPVGYFDALPQQVLGKVIEPKAKAIPLFARTWMRVAAAAVIASAVLISSLQVFSDKKDVGITAEGPQQTNEKLVAQNKPAITQEIKKVSTSELEQFIENVPAVSSSASEKGNPLSEKEAQALLKDVSVNEMEKFLSDLPASDDELSLTD